MFTAGLFTIGKLWKQTAKMPTIDERIKKIWYLYTIEFYSAMKKNEMLSFTSKWRELENIILSEVSQLRRPKIICSPSYLDCRSRANTTMLVDFGHMLRGYHIQGKWGKVKNPRLETV
jgi:hypothetical protein